MISVIVPVYKSEETLKRCVDSILNQTDRDLEVILVVEPVPDPSGVLCDELAKSDERIRVIHETNKGVSSARNTGINNAKGEYIRFVDSDDYIDEDSNESLLKALKEDDADIVIAGFKHLYFSREIIKCPKSEDMSTLYYEGFLNMPWNKLYKRELIKDMFPTKLELGEDLTFNQKYIEKCKRIKVLDHPVCNYIQDDRGTTLSTKKRTDRRQVMMILYKNGKEFFEHIEKDDNGVCAAKLILTLLDEIIEAAYDKELSKKDYYRLINGACGTLMILPEKELEKAEKLVSARQIDYKLLYPLVRKGSITATYHMARMRAGVVNTLGMRK